MIESKFQNENEDTSSLNILMQKVEALKTLLQDNVEMINKASEASCLEQNKQRLGALEKVHEENNKTQEENKQKIGALEKLFEENKASETSCFEQNKQRLGALEIEHEENNKTQEEKMQKIGALEKLLEENNASETSCLEQNQQRLDALEKEHEENNKTQEENKQKIGALKKLLEENKASETSCLEENQQRLDALEKVHEENNKTQEENKQKIGALEKLLEENKASETSCLERNQQRLDAMEKVHEENNKTQEENKQKIGALEKLIEENKASETSCLEQNQQRLDALEKVHEENKQKIGALEKLLEENIKRNKALELPLERDPCISFIGLHSSCSAIDANRYKCNCEKGFRPIHNNEPCRGCKRNGCPSSLGYEVYRDFGCLKGHKTSKNWEDARSTCVSEGGDLFSPGDKQPLLPKDEMNLGRTYHWIGVRRNGRKGPFERINSGQKLADDSPLWESGNPHRSSENDECVMYYYRDGLLYDFSCISTKYFICEINGF